MRRIKLVVALAAAMVVLMMAAAPAMANISFGNNNPNFGSNGDHNVSFGNFGGLFLIDANRGLGTAGDIDIDGVSGLGFDSLSFDNNIDID